MGCGDWREAVPRVSVAAGCIALERRGPGQRHVLFRAVDPVTVENRDTGEVVRVPAGFLSDGSSVPGPLWGALDAEPADLVLPGFVHDYAYRRGARCRRPDGRTRAIGREEADRLHIAVCRRLRVSQSDRERIFFALRVGGRFAFRERGVEWGGRG